jgi:hypothetical protein
VLAVVAEADAAAGRAAGATAVMAPRAARLRLLQQRRMPHRIFLPTRMLCLFLPQHPRAVVAVVGAVVEAVVAEAMRQW